MPNILNTMQIFTTYLLPKSCEIIALCLVLSILSNVVVAKTLGSQCITELGCETEVLPKWEVGIAGFGVNGPDYPTSDENNSRTVLIPYFIYRGEFITAGEGGLVKAKAFEDERWSLDLSLDGAFNADSDDNKARQGMDDLDYLFGIGPELTYRLLQERDSEHQLELKFQYRAVLSTDFSNLKQRGYAFESQLRYEQEQLFHQDVKFIGSIGPVWGTEKLMDYLFQVNPQDVLSDRASYDAKAGYLGTELNLAFVMSVLKKKGRIFLGVRTNLHQGATNDNSPLFKQDTTFSVGLGFAYQLFASDKKSVN